MKANRLAMRNNGPLMMANHEMLIVKPMAEMRRMTPLSFGLANARPAPMNPKKQKMRDDHQRLTTIDPPSAPKARPIPPMLSASKAAINPRMPPMTPSTNAATFIPVSSIRWERNSGARGDHLDHPVRTLS